MCMKYKIPNNVRMVGVSLLVLVAIYGILSFLVKTQEGLSDGAGNTNAEVIKKTTKNATDATGVLAKLPASPNAYVDLINSYKNLKIANGISELVDKKSTNNLTTISDYNEAIDYLKTLNSVSNVDETNITAIIDANNASTSAALDKLPADNQAYIDLLTSYKNLKMANEIKSVSANETNVAISDCNHLIDYLNELSGSPMDAPNPATSLDVPTTPDISLLKKN
jgi:hypothetical protein